MCDYLFFKTKFFKLNWLLRNENDSFEEINECLKFFKKVLLSKKNLDQTLLENIFAYVINTIINFVLFYLTIRHAKWQKVSMKK